MSALERYALQQLSEIEVETKILDLVAECRSIRVTDQPSYDLAVDLREAAKALLAQRQQHWDDLRVPAYRAYQAVLDKQNAEIPPIKANIKLLDDQLVGYTQRMRQEQQRLEREARERAEAEARERQLQAAAEAEAAGYDEASVEAILDAPAEIITPEPVAPVYQKSSAIQTRDNWSAEVYDLHALVKYVAKNKTFLGFLEANQTRLNSHIRGLVKNGLENALPGVRAVNKPTVATNRRG